MYQAKSGVKNCSLYWGVPLQKFSPPPVYTFIKPNLVSKKIPFVKKYFHKTTDIHADAVKKA